VALDDVDMEGRCTPRASEAERLLTRSIDDARQAVLEVLKKLE
jgi:hypothetical protein